MRNLHTLLTGILLVVALSLMVWKYQQSQKHRKAPTAVKATPTATSQADMRTRANAELLREVWVVVFRREIADPGFFGSYVDSMNQGASLEGIYNGFTHSSIYREFEEESKGSTPRARQVFAELMEKIQAELPEPTYFNSASALPLARAVDPEVVSGAVPMAPVAKRLTAPEFLVIFQRASFYTLKRVLGEETLKLIRAKRQSPEGLAAWYGKWAAEQAARQIDFGLPLRNRADVAFHTGWAKSVSEDRVIWEVLNRMHRILNTEQERAKK